MPSPLFHLEIMEHEMVNAQHNGVSLPGETDAESRDEEHQEALRFAFDQLSLMAVEKGDCGAGAGLVDTLDAPSSISETCNGVGGGGYVGLQMLEHPNGSLGSPTSCSPSPEYYGTGGYHMAGPHSMLGEPNSVLCSRKRSVNMTECVPVPSSEHVAEIVGRQGEICGDCQLINRHRLTLLSTSLTTSLTLKHNDTSVLKKWNWVVYKKWFASANRHHKFAC